MAKFTYKGKDGEGKDVSMTIEANDRYAVYDVARQNGHTVSSIAETRAFSIEKFINIEKINYFLSKVKLDELVMSTRNMAAMLRAGLPLSRALSVIERQTKNPRLKGIMVDVRAEINKGNQFNAALAKYPETFSKLYVAMVRAGEESGGLAPSLETIAMQLERSSNLRKKIKGAMIYPAIVITVMVILGILMMVYVMPTITDTFLKLGVDLPLTTRILIGTSQFMTAHGLLVAVGAMVAIGGVISFVRTSFGRRLFHLGLIYLPVIGNLVKQTNSAYTGRTLSSLLASGVDVMGAIEITKDVIQNVHYKDILEEARVKVEKGSPLSETFIAHENRYPILVGEMIAVGEETGNISAMLTEIATFYETEVEMKTKDLSTIIEPILMVVIGAGVGFFALAMIAPIYSIGDSIN
jgi:type IV pilus assembly protein PilC